MQIKSVKEGAINGADFEVLFKNHFRELHAYAYSFLKDWDMAEEVVQTLFLKVWERGDLASITNSVKSYLYKSVYHDCLNHIRRKKVHSRYQELTIHTMPQETNNITDRLKLKEVENQLSNALAKLPEKCMTVFYMSRFEELKYQDIAKKLNISIKTVETQMVKALKILRKEMAEFLPIMLLTLLNLLKK